jgi:hypothetical protein
MTTSHGKVIKLSTWHQRMGLKLGNIIVWSFIVAFIALAWAGAIWLMRRVGV